MVPRYVHYFQPRIEPCACPAWTHETRRQHHRRLVCGRCPCLLCWWVVVWFLLSVWWLLSWRAFWRQGRPQGRHAAPLHAPSHPHPAQGAFMLVSLGCSCGLARRGVGRQSAVGVCTWSKTWDLAEAFKCRAESGCRTCAICGGFLGAQAKAGGVSASMLRQVTVRCSTCMVVGL